MQNIISIENGKYYHIYNRGINGTDLFHSNENYLHFLRLYDEYIEPVADTFAWCLMRNHFHLLVRIKEEEEILESIKPDRFPKPVRFISFKDQSPSKQFSNLFNAYTKAFNKQYKRTGSLFERPFKRLIVDSERYFKHLVFYIHHNPIHHGFTESTIEYPWTSYLTIIKPKPTKLKRDEVLGWFDDIENFKVFHQQKQNLKQIEHLMIDG